MTFKEFIDAIVRLSDEHTEAAERLKKKLEELLADIEEQNRLAEPLIKDEKTRKALRAWADAIGACSLVYAIDAKPAEPLIKNEKIRKAVRAWAEAWSKNKLYKHADNVLGTVDNFVIQFGQTAFIDLEEKRAYTIAELCGEEEE